MPESLIIITTICYFINNLLNWNNKTVDCVGGHE